MVTDLGGSEEESEAVGGGGSGAYRRRGGRGRGECLPGWVSVARLQNEVGTKYSFRATKFVTKNAPKYSPKIMSLYSENPRAHKNRIGTSPPPNPKIPPP